jgi:hypothetical protein
VQITTATEVPRRGELDGNGLFVRLELPWTTLLAFESIQFRYILENASEKPLPVAFPSKEYGIRWPCGGQPYLEGTPKQDHNADLDFQKAKWPPAGMEGEGIATWGELLPGHRISWNSHQIPPSFYGIYINEFLTAIRARWLIGPNRWISSEPFPIKVVNIPKSERKEVFKAQWKNNYRQQVSTSEGTAFTVLIEGRRFLFFGQTLNRITEVASGDEFEHRIDEHNVNMKITIKSATGSRVLFFDLRNGFTRETPWPINPVILNYPLPEPILPAELARMRAKKAEQVVSPNGS